MRNHRVACDIAISPRRRIARGIMIVALLAASSISRSQPVVRWWVSSADMTATLTARPPLVFAPSHPADQGTIELDPTTTFQTILGLGSSLEHSTCYNISLLSPDRQRDVIEKIVHPDKGIGMNLMRICIGTPDFTVSPWYSYNDVPPGRTDPQMEHFSLEKDHRYVLPILKLAKETYPDLRFIAAPWSPPAWMKTNKSLCGGRIDPQHFAALARYLVRFVQAYRAEGIDVFAITPQNEPEYCPDTYPTCGWTAAQQRDFIRDHLGPAFQRHRLSTKIWCYDHNFNHPQFPAAIFRDPQAARYVDGAAFHHYEGKPSAMSALHEQFPDKHVYFTEGSTFGIRGAIEITSILRNWARSYNAWVTIIDHRAQPNPGPHDCSPTCIVLNSDTLELTYRFDYFMYGHFMRFIRPGATRIASTNSRSCPNVAVCNADRSIALVVVNPARQDRVIIVRWAGRSFRATLGARSIGTFVWRP